MGWRAITTSNKKLLVTKGIATRSKDATSGSGHRYSNKKLSSFSFSKPGVGGSIALPGTRAGHHGTVRRAVGGTTGGSGADGVATLPQLGIRV